MNTSFRDLLKGKNGVVLRNDANGSVLYIIVKDREPVLCYNNFGQCFTINQLYYDHLLMTEFYQIAIFGDCAKQWVNPFSSRGPEYLSQLSTNLTTAMYEKASLFAEVCELKAINENLTKELKNQSQ